MKKIIKCDTSRSQSNTNEDAVENENIFPLDKEVREESSCTLKEKLDEVRERFEQIKEDIPVDEREELLTLALDTVTLHHENPWLVEMEEYQKTRFTENITFEMSIPSGKIVICNKLDNLFPVSEEIDTREKQWNMILHNERVRYYGDLNIGYVLMQDMFMAPRTIINAHGDVLFDYLPLCEDDGETFIEGDRFYYETHDKKSLLEGEILTGHITHTYSMNIVDYDAWIEAGGDEEALVSEDIWEADEYDPVVIPVTPGRYRFTSYASNDDFWEQGKANFDNCRGSVAKMELIESY